MPEPTSTRDNDGNTALIQNAWDPDIATLLIERGADVNAQNKEGWTALFSASSEKLARALLQHGASVTIRDKKGETPLQAAREYGNSGKIALLQAAESGSVR